MPASKRDSDAYQGDSQHSVETWHQTTNDRVLTNDFTRRLEKNDAEIDHSRAGVGVHLKEPPDELPLAEGSRASDGSAHRIDLCGQ